jgi:hypothetical protein
MLVWPAKRSRLITRSRSAAITWGPPPVRAWCRSSPSVTSRTQCRRTSIAQWPRIQVASSAGLGLLGGQGDDRVDGLASLTAFAVGLLLVLVDRAAGASDPDGLSGVWEAESGRDGDDLQGARLDPAWPRPVEVCPIGTAFQGRAFSWACRVGWLPFTVTSTCAPRRCR